MALLQRFSLVILLFTLVACGGSEGGFGTTDTDTDTDVDIDEITISLSISNTTVTGAQPAEVSAEVLRGGIPVANRVVTFTSTLGTFSPDSRTALTNTDGIATIILTAGTVGGAGEISASLSSGEATEESLGFTTLGDGTGVADSVTITLSMNNNRVTGAQPAEVSAEVLQGGIPVANTVVTFSSTLGVFAPISGTKLTDDNGIATITLTAGTIRGAGEITASLSSGELSLEPLGFDTQGDDIRVVGDVSVSVALIDSDGNPTDTITSSKPGKAIATVNGITSPVIVEFSSTLGEIPVSTAITNDNFQASVDVFAGDSLGAGSITATLTSGETGDVLFVIGSSTVTMGSGSPFSEGVADVSLAQISAGGTSVISVDIRDDQGDLYTETVEVNFSSSCSSQSLATFSTPITTSNGIATSTYLATGCTGDDPINVTANAGGINLSASASINVLAADIGSIEFVSATPENIGILGAGIVGGAENSTIIFKVKDTDGNAYNNRVVNFELNTNVGGITLSQDQATTNAEGLVQTVINSGTVPTSARVTASTETLSGEIVFTQSSLLVISTGLPDQDSFSLSRGEANPEAWNTDGVEVPVIVRLADAFNNPVPDGTAVTFTTEGGSIDASCQTVNGSCEVNWRSQDPRPVGRLLTKSFCTLDDDRDPEDLDNKIIFCARLPLENGKNYLGQKYGGRATILATAIGEESFPDLNGNGRFDESEYQLFLGNNISGVPYDLKEAFVDHNEDGFYNPEESGSSETGGELEEFSDFNSNGVFDVQDGLYNGILCGLNDESDPGTDVVNQYCADPDDVSNPLDKSKQVSTNVRSSAVIIMSGNTPYITLTATNDAVAETIANPNYVPETIDNPDYVVGGDEPETIDNPDYEPEFIDNPDYVDGGDEPETIANPDYEPEFIDNPVLNSEDTNLYIAGENTGTVSVVIADLHNQPMPAGTIVSFSANGAGSIQGTSRFVWPSDSSNGGAAFSVAIKGEEEPTNGILEISVETPLGLKTVISPVNIIVE